MTKDGEVMPETEFTQARGRSRPKSVKSSRIDRSGSTRTRQVRSKTKGHSRRSPSTRSADAASGRSHSSQSIAGAEAPAGEHSPVLSDTSARKRRAVQDGKTPGALEASVAEGSLAVIEVQQTTDLAKKTGAVEASVAEASRSAENPATDICLPPVPDTMMMPRQRRRGLGTSTSYLPAANPKITAEALADRGAGTCACCARPMSMRADQVTQSSSVEESVLGRTISVGPSVPPDNGMPFRARQLSWVIRTNTTKSPSTRS